MDIEPKSLGIPLGKKDRSPAWFALGCIAIAAMAVKPTGLSQFIASVVVLAPALWFAFGGPSFLTRWREHLLVALRVLAFCCKVALLLAIYWYVVPWFGTVVDRALHT